ncbi:hypothetical protein D3C76_47850 [compost metagenome]
MGSSGITYDKAQTIKTLAEAVQHLAEASAAGAVTSGMLKTTINNLLGQIDRISGNQASLPAQD